MNNWECLTVRDIYTNCVKVIGTGIILSFNGFTDGLLHQKLFKLHKINQSINQSINQKTLIVHQNQQKLFTI